jgi:hypothetical protein
VHYCSFHAVCAQHSFYSMLCVLCGTFIPLCVHCVLLSLHAVYPMCYFYSMYFFIPCHVC